MKLTMPPIFGTIQKWENTLTESASAQFSFDGIYRYSLTRQLLKGANSMKREIMTLGGILVYEDIAFALILQELREIKAYLQSPKEYPSDDDYYNNHEGYSYSKKALEGFTPLLEHPEKLQIGDKR